jgi:long-chain fatty acid transport protein
VWCVLLVVTRVSPVWAGGLYLQEFATPSMGVASAGAEAVAADASAALHNAAGMTRISGNQLMLTGGLAYSSVHFDRSSTTPFSGGNGGDAGAFAPLGGVDYVHSLSEDWKFGLAVFTISGAALDYDDNWTGRYQCQEVSILTVTMNPSLAYRVTDKLSVGGGLTAVYGNLEMDVAINRPGLLPDGQATIDGDDWEYGWNVGGLYELTEKTRIGAMYWSKVDLSFSGDLEIQPIGAQARTDTDLPLPQFVRGGIYHELNEKWALLGTVAWEDWSELDSVNISGSGGGGGALPKNWGDTWHYAVGVHYRPSQKWLLQTGFAYDDSPVSSTDRTADMPIDRQLRFAVGAQYKWSERTTVGAAFEYVDLGDAEINNTSSLVGEYDRNYLLAFGAYANWKF